MKFAATMLAILLASLPLNDIAKAADPVIKDGSYAGVAAQIIGNFPIDHDAVSAGKDWCFHIENDPYVENWYMRFSGQMYATKVEYAKRIRLLYTGKGKPGFASLFVGMDFQNPFYYGTVVQSRLPNRPVESWESSSTKAPKAPKAPQDIDFPEDGGCSKLEDLLSVMFEDEGQFWVSMGNPSCDEKGKVGDPNTCQSYKMDDGTIFTDKESSQKLGKGSDLNDPLNLLWWNFNGRTHVIPGAMRLLIAFCEGPKCNSKKLGYLIIGYGGSGGV